MTVVSDSTCVTTLLKTGAVWLLRGVQGQSSVGSKLWRELVYTGVMTCIRRRVKT